MRRTTVTYMLIAASLFGLNARSETVTQKEARGIAEKFFNAANGKYVAEPKMIYNGRRLTSERLFNPFYVFNSPAGGYVIISAENKAFPILAYSLADSFDPNHIPDGVMTVLKSYARDIEMIRYDSRIPYEAISAWTNIPEYIDNILKSTYSATDPIYTLAETSEIVERVSDTPDSDDLWSDLYSPDQWTNMVDTELHAHSGVAIGYESGYDLVPAVVYGKKGNYYKVDTGKRDESLWRLFATEYISEGKIGAFRNPIGIPQEIIEEVPFSFYEDFVAQTRSEEMQRLKSLEDALTVTEPIVRHHGSGSYTVDLPEPAVMARIYNLSGALARQYRYDRLMSPHIDLLGEPSGFYFALIYTESGAKYGVKLIR